MSSTLRIFLGLVFKFIISIASSLTLSYVIYLVPLLNYFAILITSHIFGVYINPILSSFIFFSIIFIIYTSVYRSCRLGPLVNVVLIILVLILNSPGIYLIVNYMLNHFSNEFVINIARFIYDFHVSTSSILILSIIARLNVGFLVMSRVLENYDVYVELVEVKRIPTYGSISSLLILSLVFIVLSIMLCICIFTMPFVKGIYVPITMSIMGISVFTIVMLFILALRKS